MRATAPINLILLTFLISILVPQNKALADYHYASHTGSDEYPYTSWETAADSIQPAIDAAEPGDTVYVASGEYEGLVVMYPADSLIAMIGAGMDSTHLFTQEEHRLIYVGPKTYLKGISFSTIWPYAAVWAAADGRDVTVEECNFMGAGGAVETGYAYVIVHNCIFENLDTEAIGYPFNTNLSLEVSNCLFRNSWNEPLNIETHHVVVMNNVVINTCGYSAFHLYVAEGGYVSITNNVVYDVCSGGVLAFVVDDTTSRLENNTLDNPTVYHNWDPGINVATSFDWRIFNNSITNADNGVRLAGDHQLSVHYSDFWNIAALDAYVAPGYNGSIDTSYGILHDDPMFLDSTDFHLQAFSPLIDAGDPAILDVDGTRSDIGAYGGTGGSSYGYQDLPPRVPDSLAYRVWNDTIYLDWGANYEADFFSYLLHRDTVSGFIPSDFNLIAEPDSSAFEDGNVVLGETYYYRIASRDNQGNRSEYSPELAVEVTEVWNGEGAEMPRMTVIKGNYPNPFNSATTIVYSVANLGPIPAEITIQIFDIMGRKVRTLVNERKEVGIYRVIWDGRGDNDEKMSAGIYFARISQWGIGFMNKPRKLVLLK